MGMSKSGELETEGDVEQEQDKKNSKELLGLQERQHVARWEKAAKDASSKPAVKMQARIRQLSSEAAGTFNFEVGQAAEIADGKMRWRLPRVFGQGS